MTIEIQVTSPSGITYTTTKRTGGIETFTTYECFSPDATNKRILKITTEPKYNSILDKEAYILKAMFDKAARFENAFLETNPETKMRMNYNFTFPNLVETFISKEQNSRRILILNLDNIITNNLSTLVPLSHLEFREHVRVDQRTSAWIMGKLLKTFVLTHGMGIINNKVERDNILINRDEHFVAFFDWSNAKMQNQIDRQKGSHEIAQLAQAITLTLGGDPKTGKLPADKQSDDEYGKFIRKLALGKGGAAKQVHSEFYTVVDKIWPHEFYPFTTMPIMEEEK